MSNKTGIPKKPLFGWLSLSDHDQLVRVQALLASAQDTGEVFSGSFNVRIVNPGGFERSDGTYYTFGSTLSIYSYYEVEVVAHDQREVLVRLTSAPQNAGSQGALCFIPERGFWGFKQMSCAYAKFLGEVKAERTKAVSLFAKRHKTSLAPKTLTLPRDTKLYWTEGRLRGDPVAQDFSYHMPAGTSLVEISRDSESVLARLYHRYPNDPKERLRLEKLHACPNVVMVMLPVSEFDKL